MMRAQAGRTCIRQIQMVAAVCGQSVSARGHSGGMNVFIIVANAILIALTLAVIVFAKQTVTESRKATRAARDTVSALENLLAVALHTAASSEAAAKAARETVQAATAGRAADERDRKVRRLRQIAELVERIFEKAAAADGRTRPAWRCMEQRELPPLLVGVEPPLPKSDHLAGSSQAGSVFAAAFDAREEIAEQLRNLHAAENP
jgi:hypothetical protein